MNNIDLYVDPDFFFKSCLPCSLDSLTSVSGRINGHGRAFGPVFWQTTEREREPNFFLSTTGKGGSEGTEAVGAAIPLPFRSVSVSEFFPSFMSL